MICLVTCCWVRVTLLCSEVVICSCCCCCCCWLIMWLRIGSSPPVNGDRNPAQVLSSRRIPDRNSLDTRALALAKNKPTRKRRKKYYILNTIFITEQHRKWFVFTGLHDYTRYLKIFPLLIYNLFKYFVLLFRYSLRLALVVTESPKYAARVLETVRRRRRRRPRWSWWETDVRVMCFI